MRLLPIALLVVLAPIAWADPPQPSFDEKVDAAIAKVKARELKAGVDTPWVIMHAAIAFGTDVTVTRADGSKVNGLEFLLNEAKDGDGPLYAMDGSVPRIRTRDVTPGFTESFILQDHVDQFLFSYAISGLGLTTPGRSGEQRFTLQTLLDASLAEFKPTQELAYTIVVTSHYLPIDATWKTADGSTVSTADIMGLAVKRDANRETEGGMHHLYGMAFALNKHREVHPGAALDGVWAEARAYLDRHIELARKLQNEDGSFSNAVFRGQQVARTPAHLVWSTGHTIEWLCLALPAEELDSPWMRKAVERLADELNRVDTEALSMGGLYHGAHALVLYRQMTRR